MLLFCNYNPRVSKHLLHNLSNCIIVVLIFFLDLGCISLPAQPGSSPTEPPVEITLPSTPQVIPLNSRADLVPIPTPIPLTGGTDISAITTTLPTPTDIPLPSPGVIIATPVDILIPEQVDTPTSVLAPASPDSSNTGKSESKPQTKSLFTVKLPTDLSVRLATPAGAHQASPNEESPMDMELDSDSDNQTTAIEVHPPSAHESVITSSSTTMSTTSALSTGIVKPAPTKKPRKSRWGEAPPTQDSHVDSNSTAKSVENPRYAFCNFSCLDHLQFLN